MSDMETLLFGGLFTLGCTAIACYGDIGCPGKRPARFWVGMTIAVVTAALLVIYVFTSSYPH